MRSAHFSATSRSSRGRAFRSQHFPHGIEAGVEAPAPKRKRPGRSSAIANEPRREKQRPVAQAEGRARRQGWAQREASRPKARALFRPRPEDRPSRLPLAPGAARGENARGIGQTPPLNPLPTRGGEERLDPATLIGTFARDSSRGNAMAMKNTRHRSAALFAAGLLAISRAGFRRAMRQQRRGLLGMAQGVRAGSFGRGAFGRRDRAR